VRVQLSALSSVFLVLAELAGLRAQGSVPPGGAVSTSGRGEAPVSSVRPFVLPSNLEADPVFQPFLDRMSQSSPTFGRQVSRLVAETGLHVKVLVEDRPRPTQSSNARTVLTHRGGSLVSAHVYLKPSPHAMELIAHELEHVLERLDGVDLQTQAGSGMVWKSGDGVFETRRAIEVGRRVAQEVTMRPALNGGRDRPIETQAVRLMSMVQQDRDSTPFSARSARVSASGRHVVFTSLAHLVEADRNQFQDIYVLELATGGVTLESVGPDGAAGDADSASPDISNDGRFIVFESAAGNLTNTQFPSGVSGVFLRDRQNGSTGLLTSSPGGQPANGPSHNPAISADGATIVFESSASDLVETGDTLRNSVGVYLIRLPSALPVRLDVPSTGDRQSGQSVSPAISADGRFVVFMSRTDLTCAHAPGCVTEPSDKNGVADIYLRDTQTSITRRLTRSHAGGDPDGPSYQPAISGDGRYVAFVSEATNLTRDDTGHVAQVYVHDLVTGVTELVSRTPNGRPANGASLRPAISQDGGTVAFQSLASNLICEGKCREGSLDINLLWDMFVYERFRRRAIRVSHDDGEWMENSRAPSLDDTGRVLAFGSRHPINGRDRAHDEDLYVYQLR
jgi:Tol biopolymer transport system component